MIIPLYLEGFLKQRYVTQNWYHQSRPQKTGGPKKTFTGSAVLGIIMSTRQSTYITHLTVLVSAENCDQ